MKLHDIHIHFLRVVPTSTDAGEVRSIERRLKRRVAVEIPAGHSVDVVASDDVRSTIMEQVETCDLIVLGLQRSDRKTKAFGALSVELAQRTDTAMIMLGGRNPTGLVSWTP